MHLEGLVDDSTEGAAYGLEDTNLSFSNSDGEKSSFAFNLQKELEKIKIPVPLTELLKQPAYQSQVASFILPPEAALTPDNIKHWQVFDDEEQMTGFLAIEGEFSNMEIDADERNLTPLDSQRKEEGNSVKDFNPWNEEIRLLESMLNKYDSIQEGEPQFLNWEL